VEWNDCVAATVIPSRKANVPYDDNQASTGNEDSPALLPDFVELPEKAFVIHNKTELSVTLAVFLQRPVRRRGEDEMHALGRKSCQAVARVSEVQVV
jgi:hypothetical protein